MAENRSALIVAVSEYQDAGLRQLVAPPQDAEALVRVLGDPAIGGFAVKTLLDQPSHQINREIEAFFANRTKDDLLLLYFSGHGLKDETGRLYFATTDTDRKFLRTTAVAATLINDVMYTCRSRRQVLILDCCYSGAFARGMTHRADETVGTGEYFKEGRGQFVLTASDALQYAFEGEEIKGKSVRSVFTHTLVEGLKTGEADLDRDGVISCDELYDYLHKHVTDRMPQQKPRKWAFAVEGDIIIARNPHILKPPPLWRKLLVILMLGILSGISSYYYSIKLETERVVADKVAADKVAADKVATKPPSPLPIPNIYGWSAQQVQALQQQTAQVLKAPVEFQDTLKDGGQGPMMVVIPAGAFSMGSPKNEQDRFANEHQHRVEIKLDFAIGKSEVTVGQFRRFVQATGYRTEAETGGGCYFWDDKKWQQTTDKNWQNPGFRQEDEHPVVCVSWNDALVYTEWLSRQTGQQYRLPTEAEWEYAARAGTQTAYYWGDSFYRGCNFGNGRDQTFKVQFPEWNTMECQDGYVYTAPVGRFRANAFDLYDMLGNVWEWTCSEYDEDYGGKEQDCTSKNDNTSPVVVRGGSWVDLSFWLRSAARYEKFPQGGLNTRGFRLAMALRL